MEVERDDSSQVHLWLGNQDRMTIEIVMEIELNERRKQDGNLQWQEL